MEFQLSNKKRLIIAWICVSIPVALNVSSCIHDARAHPDQPWFIGWDAVWSIFTSMFLPVMLAYLVAAAAYRLPLDDNTRTPLLWIGWLAFGFYLILPLVRVLGGIGG